MAALADVDALAGRGVGVEARIDGGRRVGGAGERGQAGEQAGGNGGRAHGMSCVGADGWRNVN